ncbi:hypothetical protein AB7M33_004644 [Pseudomonas sp. Y3 TE3536]
MEKFFTTAVRDLPLTLLVCFTAIPAHALTITTTSSTYEAAGVRYHFVVDNWGSPLARSICGTTNSQVTGCTIGIIASRKSWMADHAGTYASWTVPARPSQDTNMGELLSDLKSRGFQMPLTASILVPAESASDNLCISMTYAHTTSSVGSAVNLWGPCTRVKAPTLQCDFTGDTRINHRTLSDAKLDGAKASTTLRLQCRGPASVTVATSSTNTNGVRLRADNSLYSKITVNGEDATTGINVALTNGLARSLNIESTLVTRGTVAPGAFSGSTVITISPP